MLSLAAHRSVPPSQTFLSWQLREFSVFALISDPMPLPARIARLRSLSGPIRARRTRRSTRANSSLSLSTTTATHNGSLTLDTSGSIGINPIFPNHKLTIDTLGGPTWTTQAWGGAIALRNSSAIGWQLNSAGQSFGIGQSSDG